MFRRNIAAGAGLVFDENDAACDHAQAFGEKPHQHIGAAARRKRADEMDVLTGILLGLRDALRQSGSKEHRQQQRHALQHRLQTVTN